MAPPSLGEFDRAAGGTSRPGRALERVFRRGEPPPPPGLDRATAKR